MTEIAPSQGAKPLVWYVLASQYEGKLLPQAVCSNESSAEWVAGNQYPTCNIIPVVTLLAYDAWRARADALDEENKRLREAITSKHGTPSSLIEGLRAYAASTQNAEKAWHTTMADKLESAVNQPERSEP